ncbi:hypothetical protein L873DRAFT_1816980 [Choiromyces venosus 120613-1]|uniref:Transposase Tc1-like domain-containing protein n=1 Tax=Choiromyces venosus 120613-1 TaxID=1336337 RepID=A0A3N4J3C7_9PEZI|nr:hypothetical protein L873DRAFT_1816980 [Choiromyces venosus 120613-1]
MTKGASIPQELRIAILTLHSIVYMQWNEISTHLKVHPESARQMIQCSKAHVCDDFFALLNDVGHDEPVYPPGPSQKYPKGSEELERLKDIALKPESFGKNPVQLARLASLDIVPSTAYKYIHQHHNFAPYRPHRKPKLSQNKILSCIQFAQWALTQPQESFVFTDETWIEIGSPRGKLNVWRPVGSDPYDFAIPTDSRPQFTLMLSGHFVHGYRGEPYIWVRETRKQLCTNAHIPGTEEHSLLESINAEIHNYNQNQLPNNP